MSTKAGQLQVTVVDDSILGGVSYREVREFIREKFIVKAVVSLPGDAFQRSKARVKTSLLLVEKKRAPGDDQPPVFMTYCTAVGIDDSLRQRILPSDRDNRVKAESEIKDICTAYENFLAGEKSSRRWVVPAERILNRMDVKNCLLDPYRRVKLRERSGLEVSDMSRWIQVKFPLDGGEEEDPDCVQTSELRDLITQLRVRYDGFAEAGETIMSNDSTYRTLYRVHAGDLTISNINAVHGAVAVVPEELDGCFVTSEYTVCEAKPNVDVRVVWTMLRSPEARANLLLLATGIGRSRVKADAALSLKLPVPSEELRQGIAEAVQKAEGLEREAIRLRETAMRAIEETLRSVSTILRHMVFAFSEQPQLSRNRGRGDSSHDRVESSTSPESGGTHGLPGIEVVACEPFCEVVFFAGGLIQAWWGKIGG